MKKLSVKRRCNIVETLASTLGEFLADHPWACIICSVVVAMALAVGLVRIRLETDIRQSFSPAHSETARETKAYLDFYNLTKFPQRSFVHFSAIDGGDMLRPECLEQVKKMDARFISFLSQRGADNLAMCEPICNMNAPFHYFLKQLESERRGEAGLRSFSHPSSRFNGANLFVGTTLFGVTLNNDTNSTMRIANVKSIVLWYFARADTPERLSAYKNLTLRIFDDTKDSLAGDLVRIDVFGDIIANHEMIRGALEATRMMSVGFLLLLCFVALVLVKDWPLRQLPIVTAAAIATPLLSTAASFGLLSWLGIPAYSIQCVAPFLVLGIGVDDAFILFHWWNALRGIGDLRERSRVVFAQISASITITSATNIVAFGIGFFTPTPQMSFFCLATSLSLFFDYILTYTILGPVVFLLSSRYTEAPSELADEKENEKVSGVTLDEAAKPVEIAEPVAARHIASYASFLTSFSGQLFCLLVVVALFTFSTFGVFKMKASFEPAKAFPSDSPLATSLQRIKPVFNETFPLSVYVHSPPNISDAAEYGALKRLLSELEGIEGVWGSERTLLFLNDYEAFDRQFNAFSHLLTLLTDEVSKPYTPSLHNMPTFLDLIDNPVTIHFERPPNGTKGEGKLKGFYMAVTAHGMSEWARRAELVDEARKILLKYPSLNATLFDGDSAVLHLLLTVGQDLIGSILVTVISMAIICWLFVWNIHAVVIISSIITSICYCLVGVLSWWGADLDPVTQVDVLLATGFSVDYTAHIAFQFCRARGTARERVTSALKEMSAPLLQAGISTLLCMLPLIFVKTYAILAFAKTVFAVVFLGLLHGLFILPVLLAIYPPRSLADEE